MILNGEQSNHKEPSDSLWLCRMQGEVNPGFNQSPNSFAVSFLSEVRQLHAQLVHCFTTTRNTQVLEQEGCMLSSVKAKPLYKGASHNSEGGLKGTICIQTPHPQKSAKRPCLH